MIACWAVLLQRLFLDASAQVLEHEILDFCQEVQIVFLIVLAVFKGK
jgi:hypothetical protein